MGESTSGVIARVPYSAYGYGRNGARFCEVYADGQAATFCGDGELQVGPRPVGDMVGYYERWFRGSTLRQALEAAGIDPETGKPLLGLCAACGAPAVWSSSGCYVDAGFGKLGWRKLCATHWSNSYGENARLIAERDAAGLNGPERIPPDAESRTRQLAEPPVDNQDELIDLFDQLGPNAQRLLLRVARRLVVGKQYGDFEAQKNWNREAQEEAIDLAVYVAAKLEEAEA